MFTFNQGYETPVTSFGLNEKIHKIFGANGVLKGFDIQKKESNILIVNNLNVDYGEAIVNGALIKYILNHSNIVEKPVSITLPNGEWYIYGLYSVYEKVFSIKYTNTIEDAQGTWKVFLGKATVVNDEITSINSLSRSSDTNVPFVYRKFTNLSVILEYMYDADTSITADMLEQIIEYVGGKENLETADKETIVSAINEVNNKINTLVENIGDELDIPNFAVRQTKIGDNGIKIFQAKSFTSLASVNGLIRITVPVIYFANETIGVTLKGTCLNTNGKISQFTLQVAGQLNASNNAWLNCSATCLGDIPATSVIFSRNASDGIFFILDGGNWGKLNISIEEVVVTFPSQLDVPSTNIWRDNWKIDTLSSNPVFTSTPITVPIKLGGPQIGEYVPSTRIVSTGNGLSGGGSLNSDITIQADFGDGNNQIARGNHTHEQYATKKIIGEASANKVVVTDGVGDITTSTLITTDELNTLDGIRSNIQGQLNSKAGTSHTHSNYLPTAGGTITGNLNVNGNLRVNSTFNIGNYTVIVGKTMPSNPAPNTILFKIP